LFHNIAHFFAFLYKKSILNTHKSCFMTQNKNRQKMEETIMPDKNYKMNIKSQQVLYGQKLTRNNFSVSANVLILSNFI